MFEQDKYIAALRKSYRKLLLTYLGTAVMSMVAVAILVIGPLSAGANLTSWGISALIGLALAAVEYALERLLFKKGKQGAFLWTGMILGIVLLHFIALQMGLPDAYAPLFFPLLLGFGVCRPLIPAVGLIRDGAVLREGDLNETVGRMKKNSRRETTSVGRETYLLFEDELTHEVHLLRAGSISPTRRYRVFYLPHSGLAVGEEIPDDVAFDPFGNPIKREIPEETAEEAFAYAAQESYTEKSDYNEDGGYAVKPDYTEESDTMRASYDEPHTPERSDETVYRDSRYDPNSPERQKAAKYATAAMVCKVLTYIFLALAFIAGLAMKVSNGSPVFILFFLPLIVTILLSSYFKKQELVLRCTKRAIAICIDTVRRRSGKHSHLHPIVEYEAEGRHLTAELSVTCTRGSVGETYTIYYDPLDPTTVRAS